MLQGRHHLDPIFKGILQKYRINSTGYPKECFRENMKKKKNVIVKSIMYYI